MDSDVNITRLGKAQPGDLGSSWKGDRFNDPAPIVLMTSDAAPAVFYRSKDTDTVRSSVEQRLERLNREGGLAGFFHKNSPFPITVSGNAEDKNAARQLNFIMSDLTVADLNGDGNEELILPRSQGDVAVLSPAKKIFEFQPPGIKHKFYDFSVDSRLVVRNGARDTVFLVMNRQIHADPKGLPADAKAFYDQTDNSYLLKIDIQGITPLRLEGLDLKTHRIVAVGAVSHDKGDELIVCSAGPDDREMSLARYSPAGRLLEPPRAFYADEIPNPHLEFTFVPASATTLAYSGYTKKVYFITPENPVNWIRALDLQKLFPPDGPQAEYLGAYAGPNGTLALLRLGREVYALDPDQRFNHWHAGRLLAGDTPKPMLSLPEESPQHDLSFTQVVSRNGDPALLTLQARLGQPRQLSDEELDAAARRFLLPDEYQYCQGKTEVRFTPSLASLAASYCRRNDLPCPDFNTIDDIKTHIPEFFQVKAQTAALNRRNCLVRRLFVQAGEDPSPVDETTYNQPKDYLRWLEQQQLSPEIVIRLTSLDGRELETKHLSGYELFRDMSALTLPEIAYRVDRQGRGLIVTALTEVKNNKRQRPAYYMISW